MVVRHMNGDAREVDVIRARKPGNAVQLGNLPPLRVQTEVREARTPSGQRVGVIRFNVWMIAVGAPFAAAIDTFRDAEGVVIDLRGNPGGLAEMMRGIAGHVLAAPEFAGHDAHAGRGARVPRESAPLDERRPARRAVQRTRWRFWSMS